MGKTGITTNFAQFMKGLDKWNETRKKAATNAVKIEGFRLMRALQSDIRHGRAGNTTFAPRGIIAQKLARGWGPLKGDKTGQGTNRPLSPLAVAMGYNAIVSENGTTVEIGAVDTRKRVLSKSWVRIVEKLQAGFTDPVNRQYGPPRRPDRKTPSLKGFPGRMIATGGAYKENKRKRAQGLAKYFFLRKSTMEFKTPARPIIEPFYRAQLRTMMTNIRRNFQRKMRGERI